MNNADFEKIAGQLAEIATTAGTEKTANRVVDFLNSDSGRYLLGGLGGAGAGAILGATQPDKAKRNRNMLYYGTLGGLGGVGLAHALNRFGGEQPDAPAATAAAVAAQQKAEAAAAAQKELVENFPVAGAASAAAAGFGANRYVGKPIAAAVDASAAAHTKKLDAAQALAAKDLQTKNLASRRNVASLFDKKLNKVVQQNAADLSDVAVRARAAQALTGVPAQKAIDQLKAQQAARVGQMNKNYGSAADRLTKNHAAAEAANAAEFARRMGRRGRGLGALNLGLRLAIPAAATYGGFQAPAAAQQYISGE